MKNNIRFAIGVFCFMILFAFEGVVTQPRLYPIKSHIEFVMNVDSGNDILLNENDFLGYHYDLKALNFYFVLNNQGVKKINSATNTHNNASLYKNGDCLIESNNVYMSKQKKMYFKSFKSENELKKLVSVFES